MIISLVIRKEIVVSISPGIAIIIHDRIDLRHRFFLSRRESNYPCCHEGCHQYLQCRRDGEKSDVHVSDHRVNRNSEIDFFSRYETDCSLSSDVGCLGCQNDEGANRSFAA